MTPRGADPGGARVAIPAGPGRMLTGGTAYALDGSNTVFTDDLVNGDVKVADIGQGRSPPTRSPTTRSRRRISATAR